MPMFARRARGARGDLGGPDAIGEGHGRGLAHQPGQGDRRGADAGLDLASPRDALEPEVTMKKPSAIGLIEQQDPGLGVRIGAHVTGSLEQARTGWAGEAYGAEVLEGGGSTAKLWRQSLQEDVTDMGDDRHRFDIPKCQVRMRNTRVDQHQAARRECDYVVSDDAVSAARDRARQRSRSKVGPRTAGLPSRRVRLLYGLHERTLAEPATSTRAGHVHE